MKKNRLSAFQNNPGVYYATFLLCLSIISLPLPGFALDSTENIDAVDGTGRVAPASAADIFWLIVPAPGASNGVPRGTLYYVGATLRYTIANIIRDRQKRVDNSPSPEWSV